MKATLLRVAFFLPLTNNPMKNYLNYPFDTIQVIATNSLY